MALSGWQGSGLAAQMYGNTVTFYRPVKDANKNPIGVTYRSGPYQCNWQESSYFYTHTSPAGDTKMEDIFQANVLRLQYDADFKAGDYLSGTTRLGITFSGFVDGEPQRRQLLGYSTCKVVPIILPDIIP